MQLAALAPKLVALAPNPATAVMARALAPKVLARAQMVERGEQVLAIMVVLNHLKTYC